MNRPIFDPSRIHPAVQTTVAGFHADVVAEVAAAVAAEPVVVVGMAHNPYCRQARRSLDAAGLAYRYLEYGNYFSQWKRRLALKLWSGWPTLPMVFVRGQLVGGAQDLQRLIERGELPRG